MRERFIEWSPKPDTLAIVQAAVIAADEMRGYQPTLRTVYYNLVVKKIITNSQKSYNRLKALLTKARNAGMFDWESFVDKGRELEEPYIREDATELLEGLEHHISADMWADQEFYVEVWVEKQAQEGVVDVACADFSVPWLACKGFVSATAAYDAGKRFAAAESMGKKLRLIHLGDHDPSGMDMTRDNRRRLIQYGWLENLQVDRIALNMDQIEEYDLPPDPAKESDSRYARYVEEHGSGQWELDAIKPQILEPIIKAAISKYIDPDAWRETKDREAEIKKPLVWLGDNAEEVLEFINTEREARGE